MPEAPKAFAPLAFNNTEVIIQESEKQVHRIITCVLFNFFEQNYVHAIADILFMKLCMNVVISC